MANPSTVIPLLPEIRLRTKDTSWVEELRPDIAFLLVVGDEAVPSKGKGRHVEAGRIYAYSQKADLDEDAADLVIMHGLIRTCAWQKVSERTLLTLLEENPDWVMTSFVRLTIPGPDTTDTWYVYRMQFQAAVGQPWKFFSWKEHLDTITGD